MFIFWLYATLNVKMNKLKALIATIKHSLDFFFGSPYDVGERMSMISDPTNKD